MENLGIFPTKVEPGHAEAHAGGRAVKALGGGGRSQRVEIVACGKRGDSSVREWQGEKMKGKSEAQRSNCPQNGRLDKVECLGVTSDGRWIQ